MTTKKLSGKFKEFNPGTILKLLPNSGVSEQLQNDVFLLVTSPSAFGSNSLLNLRTFTARWPRLEENDKPRDPEFRVLEGKLDVANKSTWDKEHALDKAKNPFVYDNRSTGRDFKAGELILPYHSDDIDESYMKDIYMVINWVHDYETKKRILNLSTNKIVPFNTENSMLYRKTKWIPTYGSINIYD